MKEIEQFHSETFSPSFCSVDEGSLAEEQGLSVGDQILMVNGISFRNILHEEAASVLKSQNLLMMSVQVQKYFV